MKTKALVVLSGGEDSTVCLFIAKHTFDEVHAVTFDYGQRHSIELDAACKVAAMAGVASHEIIDIRHLLVSTSPLTSDAELEQYEDAEQMERVIGTRIEKTFVPLRNMLFLTIALNRAVAGEIPCIITGICQADNANYPDCTEVFRDGFQVAGNLALGTVGVTASDDGYRVLAPLMDMSKAQTAAVAHTMPDCWEALAYTHTSYDGKYPPTDMNHANVLRAKGFEDAGLPDPLVLRAVKEGLMQLPSTRNYDGSRTA